MPARPDVAIMLFDLNVSGVARNAVRIANAAHSAGLNTEVWLAQPAGDLRMAVDPAIVQRYLGLQLDPGYTRRDRKLASNSLVGALASLLAERRPSVAFSSGNHFHDLATAAWGKLATGDMRLLGRVSNAAPNVNRSANPLKIWMKRRKASARYAAMDHLVAVSGEIRDELVNRLKVASAKVSLIPNGVDVSLIQRRSLESEPEWPWDEGTPVLLGVGRLTPQKNFGLLIEAFALVRRQRPLRLTILGSGPDGAREALMEQARSLGVAADVWMPGQVSNPFPYYRRADLFVLPSRWEGMSNALLEAMACGCPVAAARSAVGSAEILDGERYGRLTTGEALPLAEVILASLARRTPAEMLVGRAREFDLARSLDQYVELFRNQLSHIGFGGKH